jgi:hypothetical protein
LTKKWLSEFGDVSSYGNANLEIELDTVFAETDKPRRGPRVNLSAPQLHNRRDQLLQLFEGDWGRLGWELQQCKQTSDLIRIFSPLLNTYASEVISIFCRPSDEVASGHSLKKIRQELRTLGQPTYDLEESKRVVHDQLQEIARAEATKKKRRIVLREQKKQRKQASKTEQELRELSNRERTLKSQLQKQEASFARQEIFRFLDSGRYELNPLSLANAVANLPYSGWRQSMRRNTKSRSKIINGSRMQIFKAIRFLSESVNKQSEKDIVSVFRAGIPLLPSRHSLARTELAKNWFFLERATRQSRKKTQDPTVRHFPITELYFKNLYSATQVERVVAGHEQIVLPNKRAISLYKWPIRSKA